MKQPIYLGVNIDHVATLREARKTAYPDPVHAALIAEQAGADGITVHLREDRRHICDRDVELLQHTVQTRLNLEMAATSEMLNIASRIKPYHCCLVPEKREELTTEGGLDVCTHSDYLKDYCAQLAAHGILVSLFIDPDFKQIDAAKQCNAPFIELHTGEYADAPSPHLRLQQLERIQKTAHYAAKLGITVNAGHGLHYHNVAAIAAIPEIHELNIGHSIVARAVLTGFHEAVSEMKRLMVLARNEI